MYTTFYQLRDEPFRQTPDPHFLHLAEPHRKALLGLLEVVVYRRGFLVITGPVGTGKTTLLHSTLLILTHKFSGESRIASAFLVNPTFSREEFLEAVLDEFEVSCPFNSKARRLAAFQQFLQDKQRRGSTAVLVIDEAHLLSPELLEEVRLLSNVDGYATKLLQIVLCGQPELLTMLDHSRMTALRQRIAVWRQLRLLTLPETRTYIVERLQIAGLRSESLFPSAVIEDIYAYSQGAPRLINMICDQSLRLGFEAKRDRIGRDIVHEAAATLSLTSNLDPRNTLSPVDNKFLVRPPASGLEFVAGSSRSRSEISERKID